MTNLKTITGGIVWMLIAGTLMLATFEPVEQEPATAYAAAPAAEASA